METLTQEQYKKKYGAGAYDTFNSVANSQNQETDLFTSIKNDLSQRAQNGVTKDTPGYEGVGGAIRGTVSNAAQIAGGVTDIAGEAATHLPGVGGLVKSAGEAIKGGFNAVTDKLGGTKLFKEAAAGLPENSNLDKGLKFASDAGTIAGTAAGIEQGAGALGKVGSAVSSIPSKVEGVVGSIPRPNIGGAMTNLKGAIGDVVPSTQNIIDHNIAKGLDLAPGDLSTIEAKTGNQVGKWLSDNNLIGTNKATTQAAIDAFKTQNYNAVRSEIGKVTQIYKPYQVRSYVDALKAIYAQTKDTLGLEKENAVINNLLVKQDITLADVQKVKELMDDHFSLYKAVGDVADNTTKQGLANLRSNLQKFIEDQVQKTTGTDIRALNNNVSTARALSDAITKRSPKGLTQANFNSRDAMMAMGLTYFGSPLLGAAAVLVKKIIFSPTARLRFARWLDEKSDAYRAQLSDQLAQGKVPAEVQKFVDSTSPSEASSPIPPTQ